MIVVVALGGNALLRRGEPLAPDRQRAHAATAADAIASLAREHTVVVTHGNGPQVGLLALRDAGAASDAPWPLDVLDAESEGMVGYVLEQELRRALPGVECATLLTQVLVDPADLAFVRPSKPIGPVLDADAADRLVQERGWQVARDGSSWRRVVPSPRPVGIVELSTIDLLVRAGVVVVCAGGGGIPVVLDDDDATLRGVEAVVDKDRTSALLATGLRADALVLLTDVDGVSLDWGTPDARRIRRAHPDALGALAFDEGSMGPKVDAACEFVAATGATAAIGELDAAVDVLAGRAGTLVTPAAAGLELSDPDR